MEKDMNKKLYQAINSDTGRTMYNKLVYYKSDDNTCFLPMIICNSVEDIIKNNVDDKIRETAIDVAYIMAAKKNSDRIKETDTLDDIIERYFCIENIIYEFKLNAMRCTAYKNLLMLLEYNNDEIKKFTKAIKAAGNSRNPDHYTVSDYNKGIEGYIENERDSSQEYVKAFINILSTNRLISKKQYKRFSEEKVSKEISELFINTTIEYRDNYKFLLVATVLYIIAEEFMLDMQEGNNLINKFSAYTNFNNIIQSNRNSKIIKCIKNNINSLIGYYGDSNIRIYASRNIENDYRIILLLALYVRMLCPSNRKKLLGSKYHKMQLIDMRRLFRLFCNELKMQDNAIQIKNEIIKMGAGIGCSNESNPYKEKEIKLNDYNYGILFTYNIVPDIDMIDSVAIVIRKLEKRLIKVDDDRRIRKKRQSRTSMRQIVIDYYSRMNKQMIYNKSITRVAKVLWRKTKKFNENNIIKIFENIQKNYLGRVQIDMNASEYRYDSKLNSLAYCCNYIMIMIVLEGVLICESPNYIISMIEDVRNIYDNGYKKKYSQEEIVTHIIDRMDLHHLFWSRFNINITEALINENDDIDNSYDKGMDKMIYLSDLKKYKVIANKKNKFTKDIDISTLLKMYWKIEGQRMVDDENLAVLFEKRKPINVDEVDIEE